MRPSLSNMAFVNTFTGVSLSCNRYRLNSSSFNPCVNSHRQTPCASSSTADKAAQSKSPAPDDSPEVPKWKRGNVYAPRQIRGGGRAFRGNVKSQGKRYSVRLPPNPPGLRVSAGSARGRRIRSPNVYLRPMMAKVRESLFSMLRLFDILRPDCAALDLYAGSGSVGIEALSRGIGRSVFVDFSEECVETIDSNLTNCQFIERGQTVRAKVEDFLKDGARYNGGHHYDLITITPPYEEVDYANLMDAVNESDCVGEGTFVVVEYPVELQSLPPAIGSRLIGLRNRRYGRTVVAIYACQPDVDIEIRPQEFISIKKGK